MFKKIFATTCVALMCSSVVQAQSISNDTVKIGVLNDQSGAYADLAGVGSIIAAKMAVADFGGTVGGKPIEVVSADHQNKADIAASVARRWFDAEGVDMITDNQTSSAALAVQAIADKGGKITISVSPGTTRLTGDKCTRTGFHWAYDTHALSVGTARAMVENGRKKWYFLTADYAFGHQLQKDATAEIKAAGGKVVGASVHPFGNSDFSSYLLSAQSSGADTIGLANGGADTIASIKQATEFGLTKGNKIALAGLAMFITDIHGIGLDTAKGLYLTTAFYWDRNEKTRVFSKRFFAKAGKMPTMAHAGVYSSVMHYLNAVKALGSDDGVKVAAKMRAMPVNDFFGDGAKILANGKVMHAMYLAQVKTPKESKGPWDYYKIVRTIPAEKAFLSLEKSGCPLR